MAGYIGITPADMDRLTLRQIDWMVTGKMEGDTLLQIIDAVLGAVEKEEVLEMTPEAAKQSVDQVFNMFTTGNI